VIELTIGPEGEGMRADRYLAGVAEYSRNEAKLLFASGLVTVNGRQRKPSVPLHEGDSLAYDPPEPKEIAVEAEDIPVDIVYEDEHIAVANKAAGICVHPSPGNWEHTLVNAMLHAVGSLALSAGIERPGVVHRLDKGTSGLIAFAKTDEAFAGLKEQFAAHTAGRVYLALVHGNFSNARGVIDTPYGRDPSNRLKMAVLAEGDRSAYTTYEVTRQYEGYSAVTVTLKTGRTHQIRVHMAYIGHPVIGDETYGLRDALDNSCDSQLLHAIELNLTHPITRQPLHFTTSVPQRFEPLIGAGFSHSAIRQNAQPPYDTID